MSAIHNCYEILFVSQLKAEYLIIKFKTGYKYLINSLLFFLVCNCSLVQGLFFSEEGSWYCPDDYQKLFGKKCTVCNDYIKDELVIVLERTYHQQCFTCTHCR